MAIRVYEPGEPIEFRQGSGQPWRRGVYAGPIEDLPGDHWLEGGIGVSGRHLRPARTKAKPSRPERPRRPTTGASVARAHTTEQPRGVEQPKPESPDRDEAYLRFVASQPCCACGTHEKVIAHHEGLRVGRGMSQKVDDHFTVPLCDICHHYRHSGFGAPHGFTPEEWRNHAMRTMVRLLASWAQSMRERQ